MMIWLLADGNDYFKKVCFRGLQSHKSCIDFSGEKLFTTLINCLANPTDMPPANVDTLVFLSLCQTYTDSLMYLVQTSYPISFFHLYNSIAVTLSCSSFVMGSTSVTYYLSWHQKELGVSFFSLLSESLVKGLLDCKTTHITLTIKNNLRVSIYYDMR
jgi:hypothetical protein